jgi:two-component system, sensor histidine kinase
MRFALGCAFRLARRMLRMNGDLSGAVMLPPQLVQSALESAPDAIVISDTEGSIVFANRQVAALFGCEVGEIIGRRVETLLPERFRSRHLAHREGYGDNPRMRPMGAGFELFALREDGNEFPVEISLSPIRDGDHLLIAAAIRDVTERKRIEAELVAAREAADRANLAKSRFLATASHDLRQPLQALSLLNGTLRRMSKDPVLSEAFAQQEQAIGAMSRLLNALLDISKLEAGVIKPELTDFTVAALFEELRNEFAQLAVNKGLELNVQPCADTVRSDPSLVEQILRNLLSNAIKYTRRGSVLLRCLHRPSIVTIEVLDTGIGIPADQMPYIYDEFYQVGVAPNTTHDGYGLGLSIVSRLVKLLDLKLEVHSEPGEGSSFSLQLPASRECTQFQPTEAAAGEEVAARAGRAQRVLLVEDDASVRNAMRMLLAGEGYEIATAGSMAEALQLAADQREPADLLITDFHLGAGATGLELVAALRARHCTPIKSILVSGDTSLAIRSLKPDRHLRIASKPLRAEQLLRLITELLEDS